MQAANYIQNSVFCFGKQNTLVDVSELLRPGGSVRLAITVGHFQDIWDIY